MRHYRVAKWDNIKCFLIFLVVVGHVIRSGTQGSEATDAPFLYIYLFHMPAFLFLSGLFSKRTIQENKWFRIFSYLILSYFIKLVLMLQKAVIDHSFEFEVFNQKGVAWYGMALFLCCLIALVLKHLPAWPVFIGSIIVSCAVGYLDQVNDMFALSRTFVFFPFFWAGYCMDAGKLHAFLDRRAVKLLSGFLLLAVAVIVYFRIDDLHVLTHVVTAHEPYSEFPKAIAVPWLARLLFYIPAFLMSFAFFSVIPNRRTFLTEIGGRSIQIYALHRGFVYILFGIPAGTAFLALFPHHIMIGVILVSLAVTWFTGLGFWHWLFIWFNPPFLKSKSEKKSYSEKNREKQKKLRE